MSHCVLQWKRRIVSLGKVWSNSRGLESLKVWFWWGLYKCGWKAGVRASTEDAVKEMGVRESTETWSKSRDFKGLHKMWSKSWWWAGQQKMCYKSIILLWCFRVRITNLQRGRDVCYTDLGEINYWGADRSLARPGRKQTKATKL